MSQETPIPASARDRSDEQRLANKPPIPILAPLRDRHALDAIHRSSRIANSNSVALPHVDMVADIALIREGYGDYLGGNRWRVNDRIYAMEGTGRMFPVNGDGIVELGRSGFKAYRTVVTYNGDEARARQELEPDPFVSESDILIALELYRLRSKP